MQRIAELCCNCLRRAGIHECSKSCTEEACKLNMQVRIVRHGNMRVVPCRAIDGHAASRYAGRTSRPVNTHVPHGDMRAVPCSAYVRRVPPMHPVKLADSRLLLLLCVLGMSSLPRIRPSKSAMTC